ncbi:MAG: radical SAM protein [Candidatus Omnitrophica bacterium]|nr:radical SAM protein [Candidatus Omnitrophota bacterium]
MARTIIFFKNKFPGRKTRRFLSERNVRFDFLCRFEDILKSNAGNSIICATHADDSFYGFLNYFYNKISDYPDSYIHADLSCILRPEVAWEYIPSGYLKKMDIGKRVDFLPDATLNMKHLNKRVVLDFEEELLVKYVGSNLDKYKYPRTINLEPTPLCNLKCRMCNYQTYFLSKKDKGTLMLSVDLTKKIAEEINEWPVKPMVELSYRGEALLNPEITKIIEVFTKHKIYVSLLTNGQLVTEELLRKFRDSGLSALFFSIDGFDKETYELIRRGASFDKITASVEAARKIFKTKKNKIGIKAVRMEENRHQWQTPFDKYAHLVDTVSLQNCVVFKDNKFSSLNMFGGFLNKNFCILPWHNFLITSNGDTYVCGVTDTRRENEILGNVNDSSISDIWNGENFSRLRYEMLSGKVTDRFQCFYCSRQPCSNELIYQEMENGIWTRVQKSIKYTTRIKNRSYKRFTSGMLNRIKRLLCTFQ